ncbi:complement C5-like isoform X1 [Alexandromys fortis]|uniref:complement C5-like isoform X1 n=1 Tax=Alexandromys fortis TaxID=100897 RepID=UPI00215206EB|nr:complement C5-like isoform X1 [Microtus fortis]
MISNICFHRYGRWMIQAKYREDASTNGMTHFDVNEHNKAFKINLTPVSDRQQELKIQDEAQDMSLQPPDYLRRKITEQASTYKHPVIRTCCYDGARLNNYETCEQRADRVKIGPRCVQAFTQCCTMATEIRASDTFNEFIDLGRAFLSSSDMQVQPFNHSTQEVEIRGYRPFPRHPGLQSQLEDKLQINRDILS